MSFRKPLLEEDQLLRNNEDKEAESAHSFRYSEQDYSDTENDDPNPLMRTVDLTIKNSSDPVSDSKEPIHDLEENKQTASTNPPAIKQDKYSTKQKVAFVIGGLLLTGAGAGLGILRPWEKEPEPGLPQAPRNFLTSCNRYNLSDFENVLQHGPYTVQGCTYGSQTDTSNPTPVQQKYWNALYSVFQVNMGNITLAVKGGLGRTAGEMFNRTYEFLTTYSEFEPEVQLTKLSTGEEICLHNGILGFPPDNSNYVPFEEFKVEQCAKNQDSDCNLLCNNPVTLFAKSAANPKISANHSKDEDVISNDDQDRILDYAFRR